MSTSKIEWTEETWNPVIGCAKVSAGCKHCYAETMAKRLAAMGKADYPDVVGHDGRWNGKAKFLPHRLDEPLRRKKPTMYFVNSMSDLFHEDITFQEIAAIFGVMAACPQHTFQVLTKRPERALEFFAQFSNWAKRLQGGMGLESRYVLLVYWQLICHENDIDFPIGVVLSDMDVRPLPNVWLGVSVENQEQADKRIPLLLQIPAAVRFLSCEPLLGPVNLRNLPIGDHHEGLRLNPNFDRYDPLHPDFYVLHWVIVGGESGPGARPYHEEWARCVIDQCKAAGVPVFHKQYGSNPWLNGQRIRLRDKKGGDPSEWPEDLRVRQMPEVRA